MAQMVKNLPARQETRRPVLGRSPREGNGDPLQYSCLENPMRNRNRNTHQRGRSKSRGKSKSRYQVNYLVNQKQNKK